MKSLRERPLIGAVVILLQYIIFLAIPVFLIFPIIFQLYDFNLITSLWIDFSFIIGFLLLLLLVIIPYGFHLPMEFDKYTDYLKAVGLSKIKPFSKILFTTLVFSLTFFGFAFIGSIMLGQTAFNFIGLFQTPTTKKYGYFTFIRQLRPAICEELAFRGIILTLLLNNYSENEAISINAMLFGVMHVINLFQGADLFSTLFQVVYATIFGIVFALIFKKTKSLVPPITIHYFINIFSNVFYQASGTFIEMLFSILLIGILIPSIISIFAVNKLY
ncbi:MAG: type II CAAX prenyl endopeptidase Rce1 family protein [Promethearchaeia archaeon]